MTDATDFELDDDTTDTGGKPTGKGLREQLERALTAINQLTEENKSLKDTSRKATLADILVAKGIDPIQADLYPVDREVTAEEVQKWGETYKLIAPAAATDAAAANPAAAASALISQTTGEAGAPDIGDLLQQLEALRGTPGAAKQARDAGLLKRG